MRHAKRPMYLAALTICLGVGSTFLPSPFHPENVEASEPSMAETSALLDGKTFVGRLGPLGKAADAEDRLVFANGTFTSVECDRRCGYPPAPYFVRRAGKNIEFVSESDCLNSNATLEWRGTVQGDTVKGRLYWTSRRWYWTVEKEFWFEGKIVGSADPVAGNR